MRPIILFISFILVCLASIAGQSKSLTHTHHITIENMKFNPQELTVSVNDQIIWTNKDLVPHTVTADNGNFDSKIISPEKTWALQVKEKGAVSYKCSFHPVMTAKIVIK